MEQEIPVTKPACITQEKIKEQHKKMEKKLHRKNQIAIDTRTQGIIAHKVARGPRHDSEDAISTIKKTKKYKPSGFSLDKSI